MISLNKEIVANMANNEGDVVKNGRLLQSTTHAARYTTLYFFHEEEETSAAEGMPATATRAFAVPVEKPVTRARAINAAEMEAYGLRNAMDVASFNASLARKWRENPTDKECIEHDEFISAVKQALTAMGI